VADGGIRVVHGRAVGSGGAGGPSQILQELLQYREFRKIFKFIEKNSE
jgi:hypothetical protein